MKILQRFIAVFLNLFFTTPPSRTFPLFQASLAINKLSKQFFFFLDKFIDQIFNVLQR